MGEQRDVAGGLIEAMAAVTAELASLVAGWDDLPDTARRELLERTGTAVGTVADVLGELVRGIPLSR